MIPALKIQPEQPQYHSNEDTVGPVNQQNQLWPSLNINYKCKSFEDIEKVQMPTRRQDSQPLLPYLMDTNLCNNDQESCGESEIPSSKLYNRRTPNQFKDSFKAHQNEVAKVNPEDQTRRH